MLRKKYSIRDVELRMRIRKSAVQKSYERGTELGRKIREMSCLEIT